MRTDFTGSRDSKERDLTTDGTDVHGWGKRTTDRGGKQKFGKQKAEIGGRREHGPREHAVENGV